MDKLKSYIQNKFKNIKQFEPVLFEAYKRLKGRVDYHIEVFLNGSISEPLSLGWSCNYLDDGITPAYIRIYDVKGWSPSQIPGISDCSPDGNSIKGFYWSTEKGWVRDDFQNWEGYIVKRVEEDILKIKKKLSDMLKK